MKCKELEKERIVLMTAIVLCIIANNKTTNQGLSKRATVSAHVRCPSTFTKQSPLLTAPIIYGSMLICSSAIDRGTSSIAIFQRHLSPTDLLRVLEKGFSPLGDTRSPLRKLRTHFYVPQLRENL
jgi:hypothetical protein